MKGKSEFDLQCMRSLKKNISWQAEPECLHRNRVLFSLTVTFSLVVSVARLLPVDRPNSFF